MEYITVEGLKALKDKVTEIINALYKKALKKWCKKENQERLKAE